MEIQLTAVIAIQFFFLFIQGPTGNSDSMITIDIFIIYNNIPFENEVDNLFIQFMIWQNEASINTMEDISTDEHSDFFIDITVSEPQKIGEGMGSYLAYK